MGDAESDFIGPALAKWHVFLFFFFCWVHFFSLSLLNYYHYYYYYYYYHFFVVVVVLVGGRSIRVPLNFFVLWVCDGRFTPSSSSSSLSLSLSLSLSVSLSASLSLFLFRSGNVYLFLLREGITSSTFDVFPRPVTKVVSRKTRTERLERQIGSSKKCIAQLMDDTPLNCLSITNHKYPFSKQKKY